MIDSQGRVLTAWEGAVEAYRALLIGCPFPLRGRPGYLFPQEDDGINIMVVETSRKGPKMTPVTHHITSIVHLRSYLEEIQKRLLPGTWQPPHVTESPPPSPPLPPQCPLPPCDSLLPHDLILTDKMPSPGYPLPPGDSLPLVDPLPPDNSLSLDDSTAPRDTLPSGDSLRMGDSLLPEDSFLFLVEDLSPRLIEHVGYYLCVPPEVFIEHSSGGEAGIHYHDEKKINPKCLGCRFETQFSRRRPEFDSEISSMSWWSAGTYSVDMHSTASHIRKDEQATMYDEGLERVAWKRVAVPPAAARPDPAARPEAAVQPDNPNPPESRSRKKRLRFDCRIFRAYQAITELENNAAYEGYICAVEERVTSYISSQNCGL